MQVTTLPTPTHNDTARYAKCIEVSKVIRWDLERDLLRGRGLDTAQKYLPDGLTKVQELAFLSDTDKRFLSQVQGRTYANMFGLVERYIGAKMLELSHADALGDQTRIEALVRFTDEELKHQELFRRMEVLAAQAMPEGYSFLPQPNEVAAAVLAASTWAVLALTCHIELFTLVHYRQSVEPDTQLSDLFKDVLLYHWREESQHAILDELEWQRHDATLLEEERDRGVNDLIALVGAVDGILQLQAPQDAAYFMAASGRTFTAKQAEQVHALVLKAYRWQYIVSGVQDTHFAGLLSAMVTGPQAERVGAALAPLMASMKA
ncbi:MAG: hypothetical protein IPL96_03740 [Holophagaceae bacterium]|nr:hypothetical protein [Holophagaceae bacterium]